VTNNSESLLGDPVVRREVVAAVEVDLVDLGPRHEGLDLYGLGAL
jgi:hypothetical protein